MTTCPDCGGRRWELIRVAHHVLHLDVDLSDDRTVVERIVDDRQMSGLVGATCQTCGHDADPVLTGYVAAAAGAGSSPATATPLAEAS